MGRREYFVLHFSLCVVMYLWSVFFLDEAPQGAVSADRVAGQGTLTAAMADKERSEAEKISKTC